MTAPTTTPEITRYRDAVRASLADLSAVDRDDLMEDVESHLTEVAAEDGGSLARLGSPAEYAAELRTSAGLPASSAPVRTSFWTRLNAAFVDSAAGRGAERIAASRSWQSLRSFLPELRPGWWVLRGYLVAVVVGQLVGLYSFGLLPTSGPALLLSLVAIWASVRLGRYAKTHRSVRPWIIAGTALLILFYVLVVGAQRVPDYYYDEQQAGLVGVSNIYVFDSEGRPLTGVQLFDQDGNPLQVADQAFDANGMPVLVRRHYDVNGREVFNVFPREAGTNVVPKPQIIAPRLAPTVGPSDGPSPGGTPAPAPTGEPAAPSARPSPR